MPADEHAISPFGDDALTVAIAEPVLAIEARAELLRAEGWAEAVLATTGTLTLRFDPLRVGADEAASRLRAALARPAPPPGAVAQEVVLPIRYDGPDLGAVARMANMTTGDLVEAHAAATYTVAFLGFTPGFAYLDGLDARLSDVTRLASPRVRVPAGSVGIAGGRSGVYALPGPGGWPLIGTTDGRLFDSSADDPFALRAGATVRFEPS
ncbi:5-oxoprolinase subunit B family protein [Parvularcula dongshanensis]|uniref:KipI family sensor histidine kinase inhibitor n=1 Tax=Parvularcula dongshanensis TaxID=1173995 RepID=A0A840I305_9PROT|nr:allophanate hydrolase subunit 1 [Parvularcula dongshanensis]MBB4658568.1 KipI family sensor histidine kinase inhibitor [Parvularcula dongshanensis]